MAGKSLKQTTTEYRAGMIADVLRHLGVDLKDPNFKDTPRRILKVWEHFTENINKPEEHILNEALTAFPSENSEMVFIEHAASTICPHHWLIVHMHIYTAYVPDGKVVGLSKIPRLIEILCKRPVLQEELTRDIGNYMEKALQPEGVAVHIVGRHDCMTSRGVKSVNTSVKTSHYSGCFDEEKWRNEFHQHIS